MTAASLLLGGHVAPRGQLAGPRGMVPAAGDFSNARLHTRLWFLEPQALGQGHVAGGTWAGGAGAVLGVVPGPVYTGAGVPRARGEGRCPLNPAQAVTHVALTAPPRGCAWGKRAPRG